MMEKKGKTVQIRALFGPRHVEGVGRIGNEPIEVDEKIGRILAKRSYFELVVTGGTTSKKKETT